MRMKTTVFAAVCIALPLLASSARADRRAYGVTYEAVTAPKGEVDVETWSTFAPQGEVDGGPSSRGVREMVELEYGITDRWDVALYNMLDMITSGDTRSGYAGLKLETRYRPSDRGEWLVDPVFYFEFQQLFRGDAHQKYEAKLILAKDIGDVNIAANIALEEERTDLEKVRVSLEGADREGQDLRYPALVADWGLSYFDHERTIIEDLLHRIEDGL